MEEKQRRRRRRREEDREEAERMEKKQRRWNGKTDLGGVEHQSGNNASQAEARRNTVLSQNVKHEKEEERQHSPWGVRL